MDINSIHDDSSPFPSAVKTILQAMYTQLFKGDFGVSWWLGYYKKECSADLRSLFDIVDSAGQWC